MEALFHKDKSAPHQKKDTAWKGENRQERKEGKKLLSALTKPGLENLLQHFG